MCLVDEAAAIVEHSASHEAARQKLLKAIHDIGNALARINFYCEQISDAQSSGEKVNSNDVNSMSTECTYCIDLIREVMVTPQSPANRDHAAQCYADVVAALAIDSHQNLRTTHIDIDLTLSTDSAFACAISQNSLYRCLSNLLINSRQAISAQGKIALDVSETRLAHNKICSSCSNGFTGNYVRLIIRDTGIGIFEHERENIFKAFYTSKTDGCGMGLSIVHELVHECGGHLQLESAVGIGSQFTLYIPVAKGATPKLFADSNAVTGSGH